ncbi:MAG: hypothetical protein ACR2NZ_13135 [Rubripirellula sp.]
MTTAAGQTPRNTPKRKSGADHAVIELDLQSGSYDLEATFSDMKDTWGAYFVYVSLVP